MQAQALRQLGCPLAQGFLYSPGGPAGGPGRDAHPAAGGGLDGTGPRPTWPRSSEPHMCRSGQPPFVMGTWPSLMTTKERCRTRCRFERGHTRLPRRATPRGVLRGHHRRHGDEPGRAVGHESRAPTAASTSRPCPGYTPADLAGPDLVDHRMHLDFSRDGPGGRRRHACWRPAPPSTRSSPTAASVMCTPIRRVTRSASPPREGLQLLEQRRSP